MPDCPVCSAVEPTDPDLGRHMLTQHNYTPIAPPEAAALGLPAPLSWWNAGADPTEAGAVTHPPAAATVWERIKSWSTGRPRPPR